MVMDKTEINPADGSDLTYTGGDDGSVPTKGSGGTVGPDGRYDTGMSNIYPQGNNVNDPWSTAAPWRPDAPTGGAYGAYANLASGAMNPLQQGAGYGYGSIATGGPYASLMNSLIQGQAGNAQNNPLLGTAMQMLTDQYNNTSLPEEQQRQAYSGMVYGGGYDPATKAAITNESNNSITGQYEGLKDQLQNAAARTGSPLGEFGALAQASQNAGNQRNAAARQNQVLFANEAERQKEAGAAGLGQNAQLGQSRRATAAAQWLQAQGNQNAQQQAAAQSAAGLINNQNQSILQGSNGLAQLAAQLSGQQQAGAAGLAGLDQANQSQESQLYSLLASILGTKQEDYTSLGKTTGNANVGI